jgi:hypothetical protein
MSSTSSKSYNMADENPSTSSEANSALPTTQDILNAKPKEALQMAVELYNNGIAPEYHLNWQNIQGIFDTKKDFWPSKEDRARYKQRKADAELVKNKVKLFQSYRLSASHTAAQLLRDLDFLGVIRCRFRGKWVRKEPLEHNGRSETLPSWG